MRRLIDPDILTKQLQDRHLSTGKFIQWQVAMEAAMVEVPDVIICAECKHGEVVTGSISGKTCIACHAHEDEADQGIVYCPEDYFCADGERKPACGEDYCVIEEGTE